MKKLLFTFLLLSLTSKLFAQDGRLDSTFNDDGIATTDFGGNDSGQGVAVEPDGKIVVAGYSGTGQLFDFALARYNSDGSPDSSFGFDGTVITTFPEQARAWAIAIQPDGKILVGGGSYIYYYLARYNSNGTLDSSFGVNGMVYTASFDYDAALTSSAIQPDGKIVATGYTGNNLMYTDYYIVLCRYNTDGTLDGLFEFAVDTVINDEDFIDEGMSVAIQGDLKIVVAGISNPGISNEKMVVIRFNNDFSLDNSFGSGGIVKIGVANGSDARSVAIQGDQKIVIAGGSIEGFTLVRLNVDGVLDTSFGEEGIVTTAVGSEAVSVKILEDEKIQVAGNSGNDFALARYNLDASLDSSFATNGIAVTNIGSNYDVANSMDIQPGGDIIVAGSTIISNQRDFAVVRYLSSLNVGIVDLSSPNNCVLIYPNPVEQNATLKYSLKNEEEISIQLLDVEGRILKTFVSNEKQQAGDHEQQIILPEGLANGSYLIVISSVNGGKFTVKVVK